jgi:SET domain-containing protein
MVSWYHQDMSKGKPGYAVRRSATGLGLFATNVIPARRRIIEYTGPLITNEEVERSRGKYFFGLDETHSVNGSPRSNIARYINHSCRPNAEAIITGRRIWIWSRKVIQPGEEITYNYGKEYFDEQIKPVGCKCEKCRGGQKK